MVGLRRVQAINQSPLPWLHHRAVSAHADTWRAAPNEGNFNRHRNPERDWHFGNGRREPAQGVRIPGSACVGDLEVPVT